MSRHERERTVLEIIEHSVVHTQAELVEALRARGCQVTQATVSRDIKRLGLVKTPTPDGAYRYASPDMVAHGGNGASAREREAMHNAFDEFATGVMAGAGLFAIKTQSGCANAVAIAIDEAVVGGIVATLAGDDTILVMTRSAQDRDRLIEEFSDLL
jgi:transcriptional regulator of arginine metabolism